MRDAIHRLKYNGKTALGPALAATLYSALRQQDAGVRLPLERITLIVPVPLHGWRRWRRGYNQSELLAQALWTCWRTDMATVEYCADLLQRTQYTTPQVELDEQHRAANVRDAFKVRPERLKQFNLTSLPILLIDDVCTTGATLNECARVLREAGASEIYAATLARGI
jgi:ComF family protein